MTRRPPGADRPPGKRLKWTPDLQRRVRAWVMRGYSDTQIGKRLNLSREGVSMACERYGLKAVPEGSVMTMGLALTLGLKSERSVLQHLRTHGVPLRPLGLHWYVHRADLAPLRSAVPGIVHACPDGYMDLTEIAARWQIGRNATRERLLNAPHLTLRHRWGEKRIYAPRTVQQAAPPLGPRAVPRGRIGSRDLAALTTSNPRTPPAWAQSGCPHIRSSLGQGAYYFKPHEVAAWLMARPYLTQRKLGRHLLARLAQQSAA